MVDHWEIQDWFSGFYGSSCLLPTACGFSFNKGQLAVFKQSAAELQITSWADVELVHRSKWL